MKEEEPTTEDEPPPKATEEVKEQENVHDPKENEKKDVQHPKHVNRVAACGKAIAGTGTPSGSHHG